MMQTVATHLETNCGPLLLSSVFGIPYGMTQWSKMASATCPADVCLSGKAPVNLRTYLQWAWNVGYPNLPWVMVLTSLRISITGDHRLGIVVRIFDDGTLFLEFWHMNCNRLLFDIQYGPYEGSKVHEPYYHTYVEQPGVPQLARSGTIVWLWAEMNVV